MTFKCCEAMPSTGCDDAALLCVSKPTKSVWPLSRVLLNAMRGSGEGNGDVLLAWERQMEEENAALDATIEKYKEGLQKMVDRGAGADMTSAQRLMLGWFNPLRTAIAREQQAVRP